MGGGAHPQSPPTPGRTTGCCPTAPPGAGGRGSPPGLGPHMPSQACKPPRFESGSEPLCSVPRASCLTVPPGLPFTTFLYDVCLGQSHQVLGHAPTLWPQRRSHFDDHRRMGGGYLADMGKSGARQSFVADHRRSVPVPPPPTPGGAGTPPERGPTAQKIGPSYHFPKRSGALRGNPAPGLQHGTPYPPPGDGWVWPHPPEGGGGCRVDNSPDS